MSDLHPDKLIPMIPGEKPSMKVGILSEILDYNHDLMNIPSAWRSTMGKDVKVVILDTGLPHHADIVPEGGKSFIPGYLEDQNYHSTFVGGLMAAKADNSGVVGICPEVKDYYGAVLDHTGSGSITAIIRGIRWAVDEIGADIINMSLGIAREYNPGPALEQACNYAYDQGCTIFAAAGNDAREVNWPAAYDSVIAVSAVDRKMNLARFSSRGPEVEFAAGGVDIFSTYKDNGYATMSGTSFSCPAVAAAACLIASKYKTQGIRLSPSELKAKLKKIAYDVGPEGRDDFFGNGIPVFTKNPEEAGIPKVQSWWKRLWNCLRLK